jgi:hypothetical protein
MLNTVKTEWDVSRLATRVKTSRVDASGKVSTADEKLKKYFKGSSLGILTKPTTILDQYGRVMVWALPGLLHSRRIVSYYLSHRLLKIIFVQEDYNTATAGISHALRRGRAKGASWRSAHFVTSIIEPQSFEPGVADFSPGWFMQGHEVSIQLYILFVYLVCITETGRCPLYFSGASQIGGHQIYRGYT